MKLPITTPPTVKHTQCGMYIRGYLLTDILFVLVFGIILVNKTFQQMKEKNKGGWLLQTRVPQMQSVAAFRSWLSWQTLKLWVCFNS